MATSRLSSPSPHAHTSRSFSISSYNWEDSVADINTLIRRHQTGDGGQDYQEITRKHWKPNGSRSVCANIKCKKTFTLIERPHHCRRCGDVFCNQCTKYRRRLNAIANPDPQGKPQKVCEACFDKGPQSVGQITSHKGLYSMYREARKGRNRNQLNGHTVVKNNTRERFNLHQEIERLKSGFKKSIENSVIKKVVLDVKGIAKTPDWMKSANQVVENLSSKCGHCRMEFGVLRTKNFCVLCGVATCGKCSNKELIVYIPDQDNKTETDANSPHQKEDVKLAIIRIVGCPDKEPSVCQYLRICQQCHHQMVQRQVKVVEQEQKMATTQSLSKEGDNEDVCETICSVNKKLTTIKDKINTQLPQYQELIEVLEIGPGSAPPLPTSRGKSNVQVLAKAQGDLTDHFTDLVMTIHSLKKVKPVGRCQTTMVKNFIKSSCDFYSENMFLFRELRNKLESFTPPQVLKSIQDIVELNAINSCYLSIKQLALEALHMCSKYGLPDSLPICMAKVEQIVGEALRERVLAAGEDWTHHEECLQQLLQSQLKNHRLIRASQTLTRRYGSLHVHQVVTERSDAVTQQIQLQFTAKCADRSFKTTKDALDELQVEIRRLNQAEVTVHADDGERDKVDGGKKKRGAGISEGWLLV